MAEATAIRRPRRWDVPFAEQPLADADIDRILAIPIVSQIDATRFPPTVSLRDIIRNDARIERYNRGDIIIREDDYGNSIFLILSGQVRGIFENLPEIGRAPRPRRRSWLGALRQAWTNPSYPEVRSLRRSDVHLRTRDGNLRAFLTDPDRVIAQCETFSMGEGDVFGELAALDRTPRRATVFADGQCELLEMRWQGLRELRNRDPGLRAEVDRRYHERTRLSHLSDAPLFAQLPRETLVAIAGETSFEAHGNEDLFFTFAPIANQFDAGRAIGGEPLIAEEGSYVNDLILIRSGFARVTEKVDRGHRTVGYVRANDLFGLPEVVEQWRSNRPVALRYSLRAIGDVSLLRVPAPILETAVLPLAEKGGLLEDGQHGLMPPWDRRNDSGGLEQPLVDFLIDRRIINGTATMLIDLSRCTGCDDCVRACAATHGNNPRFVRQGPVHGDLMAANACMHCVDTVCLIGCPTGAIHRDPASGRVLINEDTCIGCATCANSCPYGNIRMVEIRDAGGRFFIDEESHTPIRKATKCDLCAGQPASPACQRACPHDALVRMDMRDQDTLSEWVAR